MKKIFVILFVCLLACMAATSCRSSKPCPAYKSVVPTTSSVELPSDTGQPS